MPLIISGNEASIQAITFSEAGFGRQSADSDGKFTLTVSSDDFRNRFESIYAACVTELIRDDEITGGFHPPYAGASRYPAFDEFMSMAEHERMEMIETYFALDILRLYIPEDALDARVLWTINSLDALRLDSKTVSITGRVSKRE